jgi:CBS domain-containing protein
MALDAQKEFIGKIYPFNKLNNTQLDLCMKAIDIAYYPKNTIIVSPNKIQDCFFIIIKGEVEEFNNDELIAIYEHQDSFDADTLIYNKTNNTFKVSDDLICYELEKKIFLELLADNKKFNNFYLKNLSSKLQSLKKQEYTNDMSIFMVSKVCDLYLNKICLVDESTSIKDAIIKSIEYKTSTVVVKNGDDYGVITDSLLKKDVLLTSLSLDTKVSQIAKFPFLCVNEDDFLFNVLLLLTENTIKRVGVMKNNILIGTIEQIDILSYFANHIHLIATQINKAQTISELKKASQDIEISVKSLFIKSVATTYIAKMVSELNSKIFKKLFELIFPIDLQESCCLVIMGSEGRSEQILKTDQDNGLIISNLVDEKQYEKYTNKMIEALIDFGFPKCEGNIMVSNPFWCKQENKYSKQLDIWLDANNMEDYMNLAIFFDSKYIAGNKNYLVKLKKELFDKVKNKNIFMAFFANATIAFDTPIGMFSKIKTHKGFVDLKKGAIFAIVHGVRSLSLENNIQELSTIARIKQLNNMNIINRELSSELIEAFGLLLRLKLQGQIAKLNKAEKINNEIDIKSLSKIQRDMLKDSFVIVNKFKEFITNHFKLNNIM